MISPATLPAARDAPAKSLPHPDRFLVGCVAENTPTFLRRAHLLTRSIRWFGGSFARAQVMVCVVEQIDPHFRYRLGKEGAEVRVVRRFDSRDPFANRLQFFPEALETPAEILMLVDCDTAFVGDPLPFVRPDAIQARIAHFPTVPHVTLMRVFRHYALPQPAEGGAASGEAPTIPYCDSGVVMLPARLAHAFAPIWSEWSSRLAENLELLRPYARHCNQVSLSLALAASEIPFRAAPLALNFPLHPGGFDSSADLGETDPAIVHYRDRVATDGLLLPALYPHAQRRIEKLNERIVANDGPRAARPLPTTSREASARPRKSGPQDGRSSSAVFIVGMHRAGTSAAAQAIAQLGIPFARRSDLMPPSLENPTGYWESTVLSLFNDELLRLLGGSWSAPPSLVPGWERGAILDPLRELAKALVQTVHPTRRWAWKDPRNSLLLPFWLNVLDAPARLVLVHRNPLEICKSLAVRSGFGKPLALALWERYVRSALDCARELPTLVVPYEDLLGSFPRWSSTLRSFLGCDGGSVADAAIDPPLDRNLRHSAFSPEDVARDPAFSVEQRRLFLALEDLVGRCGARSVPRLPAETSSTRSLFVERLAVERAADASRTGQSPRGSALEGIEEYAELDDLASRASYRAYLERQRPLDEAREARLRAEVGRSATSPRISLLLGLHRPAGARLDRALRSVRSQTQPTWQLCLCDDAGNDDEVARLLADAARRDDRVLLLRHERPLGLATAFNTALAAAQGEFVAFLDADDTLSPECLAEVTLALAEHPNADLLYTDEDRLDEAGERHAPFLKPGWSPDYLLSCSYLGRLLVVRRTLLERIGGLRSEYDGAAEYDLMLRASEAAAEIAHLPEILYHRGGNDGPLGPRDPEMSRLALQSALARRNESAEVENAEFPGTFRVRRAVDPRPMVSIIIPFRDEVALLERCLHSVREFGGHEPWEAVLMDNGSWEPETKATLRRLATDPRCLVVPYSDAFNWSAINNAGVQRSRGELVLFLNNDIESRRPGWLAALVEHAVRGDVGAVGARLLYPNGMVQHAGVMLHPEAGARHPFRFLPAEGPGYFGMAKVIRNCTAVTGACMMVRRRVFEELGGFEESLPLVFNDVDFCLRLLERGYRVVYTPYAELTHHESLTRGTAHEPLLTRQVIGRWGDRIRNEVYISPNLPWRPARARLSEELG